MQVALTYMSVDDARINRVFDTIASHGTKLSYVKPVAVTLLLQEEQFVIRRLRFQQKSRLAQEICIQMFDQKVAQNIR